MAPGRSFPALALAVMAVSFAAACSSGAAPEPAATGAASPGATGPVAGSGTTAPKKPTDDNGPVVQKPVDPTTDPNAKPCTGAAGSLYALTAKKLTAGTDIPLCRFEGSVLMIVNVASHCGFTPQYAPLQAVYDQYRAQGFYVLGFPSKSFNQEFSSESDVSAFCTNEYHITFPMFAIGDVNGAAQQPVYTWLKSQPAPPSAPSYSNDIPWNFEKWIITRHGEVAKRFDYQRSPDDAEIAALIEAELAKK